MKKYLLSLTTLALLLCEASFSGGGMVFAAATQISGTDLTWDLTGGVLTIDYDGSGSSKAMPTNYTTATSGTNAAPWAGSRASITSIVVKDGITSIGQNAFYSCSNATTVQISPTVTSIGSNAFNGCSKLTRVNYQKNTISSANATSTGMWAKISFANDKANPLYYAKKLYVVKQQGSQSYSLYEASDVTFASPLTKVSQYVFINCTSITTATLNSCITEIETYAFKGCSNLASIKFGNSNSNVCNVTSVAQSAFSDCTKLSSIYCYGGMEKWLAINFEKLTATPFYSSTATNRCLYIDGTIASNKITTPTFTQNIPAYSFYKNTGLTSVTISNTVSSVGNQAFSTCPNLASVTWDVPNSTGSVDYTGSTYPPFVSCTGITSFTIGSHVVKIPRYLCYGLSGLTSITIPSGVNSIGSSAFGSCSNLATLYYEGADVDAWSNIEIDGTTAHPLNASGGDLYIGGVKQTNITLTNATIKQYAFYKCTSLTSVTLNSTVQTIQRDAFEGCANLTKANCQSLEGWCAIEFQNDQDANPLTIAHNFYVNDELQTSLNVPESILSIGNYAFYNGTCFSTISLYGSTTFGAKTFYGCVTPTIIGEVSGSFGEGLTWRLDEGVLYIEGTGAMPNYSSSSAGTPWYAYKDCITAVVFGNNITTVGNYAFSNFSRISSISWGGVTSIGTRAFEACTSLTKLELSSNISSLADYAFYNCTGINYIISANTEAPTISSASVFSNVPTTTPLYVPYSALDSYNDGLSTKWNRFTTHYPYTGNCGTTGHESEVTWTYDPETSTLTISGSGAMANYSLGNAPWNALCSLITDVVVEDGVTSVGNYAFEGCSNLENVTISNGVASIGQRAFYNCTSLETLTLPNSITAIAARLFEGCTALSSIVIPNNVIAINSYAFLGCGSLSSVSMSSVTSIGQEAFNGCASLTNITLPETLTTIGLSAFKNCGLTSITIPRNVTTITCYSGTTTYSTFEGCSSLSTIVWNARTITSGFGKITYGGTHYAVPFESIKTQITSITFGPNVEAIPNYLCHGFNTISSITIPASVTSIGNETFDGCIGITTVTSNAVDAPTISSNSFPASVKSSAPLTLVSCESKADYQAEDNWDFTTIYPNKVDFNLKEHGSAVSSQCVEESETLSVPSPAPSETGYTFGGWYDNEECTGEAFDFSTEITADLTLFAKWTIISYDVTFDLQGHGDAIDAQSINYNGLVNEPSAPSAEYYTFGGWYKEAGCSNAWDFSEDKVTDDIILYAKWTLEDLTLYDNANNASVLELYNTETTNVHLTRSLISASYNTICLPFAMTAAQVETYFGANCDIEELTKASFADGDLKLFFTKRTAIEAGKPYLIQPQSNVANPVIADVTIDNTARPIVFEGVTFTGTFSPTVLANSEDLLFLGASNTLYMSSGGTMKGMRGYFQLTTPQAQAAARRSARIVFHEEVATGIETVESQESKVESTKIMRDGQLLIIRDGKTYNAQGALIK